MRLYEEIVKTFKGGDAGELFASARFTVLPGFGGYFQGVRTVSEFSPDRVVLATKKDLLEVEGKNFVIRKYCDGDLSLSGEIFSVRLADGKRTR